MSHNKILIAYYSRRGENYVSGRIEHLAVGNTEIVAEKIQALTGGDLFQIDTVKPYPADYTETTKVAKTELRQNIRPELNNSVSNMDEYEIVYLGYPNWWSNFPMAVATFLESYDFSGKTIIPFCTHEGSGMCGEKEIRKLCPDAKLQPGIAIQGTHAREADCSKISKYRTNV